MPLFRRMPARSIGFPFQNLLGPADILLFCYLPVQFVFIFISIPVLFIFQTLEGEDSGWGPPTASRAQFDARFFLFELFAVGPLCTVDGSNNDPRTSELFAVCIFTNAERNIFSSQYIPSVYSLGVGTTVSIKSRGLLCAKNN